MAESTPEAVERFWARYAQALAGEGITGQAASWCRKHAEAYIRHTGDVRLRDQVAEDLTHYLATWVHQNPSPFVLEQKVTALRVLFQALVKTDWAAAYPWAQWKEPHLNFGERIAGYSDEREEWRPAAPGESFKDDLRGYRVREMFLAYFEKLRAAVRK